MAVRSSSPRERHSPLRIIAGLLFAVVVVGATLSVRWMNGNGARAANTIQNQSPARDLQSKSPDGFWSFIAEKNSQVAAQTASAYRSYREVRLNTSAFTAALR